jgi:hypothetical protein
MTVPAWGHTRVSSALEVFTVLTNPPTDPGYRARWEELLTIEPPFWGSLMQHAHPLSGLNARSYRLWSWDDHGVVLSLDTLEPPLGVRYRTWDFLRHELDDPPTHPHAPSLSVLRRIHADTETWPSTAWSHAKPSP